jgi:hypothetical protein
MHAPKNFPRVWPPARKIFAANSAPCEKLVGTRPGAPLGRAILIDMRQAQGPAHWTGNPPLSRRWPGSALCALAMLVFNVVCFLKMPFSRKARECHAEPAPRGLPDGTRDTNPKGPIPAAAAIDSRRRPHSARNSRPLHESCSGSTRASLGHTRETWKRPLEAAFPAKAGIQQSRHGLFQLEASSHRGKARCERLAGSRPSPGTRRLASPLPVREAHMRPKVSRVEPENDTRRGPQPI